MTIIDCISDLHGHYPKLEGGDLLIIAGDLTARDKPEEYTQFMEWLESQKYEKKILIAGNHDNEIEKGLDFDFPKLGITYLCDSGTEFEIEKEVTKWGHRHETVRIWGSPWTKTFEGMNPKCKAFTCDTEEELAEKWKLIPDDIDILVCHSPMWGMNDGPNPETRYGSTSLLGKHVAKHLNNLKLFVCGHIHEGYGKFDIREIQKVLGDPIGTIHVNASHVNERYEPVNKPVRVIL